MNPLLSQSRSSGEAFLPRLYGRVDQVERNGKWWHYLFDTVGADFFDKGTVPDDLDTWWFDRAPLRIVEITTSPCDTSLINTLWKRRVEDPDDAESRWVEMSLAKSNETGRPATIYDSLAGEGESVVVTRLDRPPRKIRRKLGRTFSLDSVPDAARSDIERAIPARVDIEYAAVYDVGQGSCNALCAGTPAHPVLYFDFGGGVLRHANTFPPQLSRWCFGASPAVVLSHWDWDHWSSQRIDPRVLDMTWIAPRQKLGPTHTAFASALSKLLVWPDALPRHTSGRITIERCTGSGRNHSGLALTVRRGDERMLFTGDARYTAVPGAGRQTAFTAVVAPHHGADMRNAFVPRCAMLPNARLAYSFGSGNTFGHPRQTTRDDHHAAGWRHSPPGLPPSLVRSTADRPQTMGHIALHWSNGSGLPPLPCGANSCQLQTCQA